MDYELRQFEVIKSIANEFLELRIYQYQMKTEWPQFA